MTRRHLLAAAAMAGALAVTSIARADEPTVLKFAYPGPLQSWPATKGVIPWAKKIKEATGGQIEITLYGAIANYRNVYDRLLNGVADFGFGTFGSLGNQFPRSSVTGLPLLADNSVETGLSLWRMYASGVIADEYSRVKPISMFGFGNSGFHMAKPVTKLQDLKGMKVLSGGRSVGQVVELIGAVPISTTPAQVYEGIDRGLAAGTVTTWSGLEQFKIAPLVKYHLDMPFGRSGGWFFMNKDSFARLPAKAQQVIDSLLICGDELSAQMSKEADAQDDADRDKVMAQPGQVHTALTAAEIKTLERVLAPMADEWVKATPDGAKVLAAYKAEIARIRKH